jgi:hypothetical protein
VVALCPQCLREKCERHARRSPLDEVRADELSWISRAPTLHSVLALVHLIGEERDHG